MDLTDSLDALNDETVFYCPNPGNAGDSAIALATYQLFEQTGLRYRCVDWYEPFDSTDRTLIYGGGGNLTHYYHQARTFIERHHERARRLIVLPHSIQGHADLLASLGRNVDLYCRERPSFEWAREKAPRANVYLAEDLAFSLDPEEVMEPPPVSTGRLARRILEQPLRVFTERRRRPRTEVPPLRTTGSTGVPSQTPAANGSAWFRRSTSPRTTPLSCASRDATRSGSRSTARSRRRRSPPAPRFVST